MSHVRSVLSARFLLRLLAIGLVACGTPLAAQDQAHGASSSIVDGVDFRVYDRSGRSVSLAEIIEAVRGEEVLLVGEEHDDMVGHTFETLLLNAVVREIGSGQGSGRPVVLSMEMFERDVQYIVDEYLRDEITEAHFLRSSRPWDDYEARYRALVEHAKAFGLPLVAANAPRRYVNRVTNEGPESLLALSAQAQGLLPPLPFPGPSVRYRAEWDALMTEAMLGMSPPADSASEGGEQDGEADSEPAAVEAAPRVEMNPNAIFAQALWDASMGHAITQALTQHLGGFVVHFVGSFHVANGTGIPERIADYRPGTRVSTVVMTKVDDIDAWSAEDHGSLADYVVLTRLPEDSGGG